MLDRTNLFLVALDDRRHWYRYHHLFADVLRARLLDERPEQIGELHLRASEWYDLNGDTAEAVGHAMAGQHVDRAARAHRVGGADDAPNPPGSNAAPVARNTP